MPPSLDRYRGAEHGLAALVSATDTLLGAIGRGVGDERVSSRPDARTLRYYQSLGILDRPLRHDGREAVYGYRHLLQAVTTKLLQAEGMSLAQIQRALAGRTTEALEAAVAEALVEAGVVADGSSSWGGGEPPPQRPPFVVADAPASGGYLVPASPAEPTADAFDGAVSENPPATKPCPATTPAAPRALLTREVAPGVLVTLDPRLVPDPDAVLARIERAVHLVPPGGLR